MRWLSSLQIDFSLPQVQFSTLTDRLRPFGANLLSYRRQQLYLRGDDHEKIANARREAEALFTSKPIRGHLSAAPPNAGQPVGTETRILRALPAGIEVDDALSISEQVELWNRRRGAHGYPGPMMARCVKGFRTPASEYLITPVTGRRPKTLNNYVKLSVGTTRGEPAHWARSIAATLYSVGSVLDPDHEAVIRFDGEAPRAAGPFCRRHRSHGVVRVTATSARY